MSKLRRSMLFLPGANAAMLSTAFIYRPDSIMFDLEDAVGDVEQRDVEGAATEVEDEDELVLLALVEAVGQGRRGGLVDDAQHVEAGDLPGFLRGLTLGVVEVRRHRDDGASELATKAALGA